MTETSDKNLPELQRETCVPQQPSAEQSRTGQSCGEKPPKGRGPRKDKMQLHAVGHGVLSKFPLQALARLGENIKHLRRIERKFREELRPKGILGAFWFDRFWSSYLRCLLAGKVEGIAVAPTDQSAAQPQRTPTVREGELPVLVWQDQGVTNAAPSAELLRELALVARYDRHFSREMYKAIGVLLILRNKGEAGLLQCIQQMVGLETT